MNSFWRIIGHACSDDAYRASVMENVRYGQLALEENQALYDFFRVESPYCLTRWELMELNRVLGLAGNDDGPMPPIAGAWDPASRHENVLGTFGLACFDGTIRDAIEKGTLEEAQAALRDGAPGIQLTLAEVEELRELLARNAKGKTVRQRMEEIETLGWVPTQHWEPFCEPGATFSTGYYHANARLVYALQLVDPIREYLSSEPPEREDETAVQTKIRDMLDAHLGGA